jgi:DNA-directed RNA polymerase specialized sigma24 family protein
MIPENLAEKAVRAVFRHLRKKFRGLDRQELKSAAGAGVAQAIRDYKKDRTDAVSLWLKIAGTQRAINALREDGFLGRDCMQNPSGSPTNPIRETDLTPGEHDQFARATRVGGASPFSSELFNHPCLTGKESGVLIARYADNRTWEETAVAVGAKIGVCRRRHDKALKKLRGVLGEEP